MMDVFQTLTQPLPYKYLPLNSGPNAEKTFRLLTLLPGQGNAIIQCSLQNTPLNSHPSYEALSYTWGDPKGKLCRIPARGDVRRKYTIVLGRRRAKITYNLHQALLQLRHSDQPRILWVDALCIDQKNKNERSEQVTMMASIFGRATKVLCWLGEGDEMSDLAFKTTEELCWVTKILLWKYGSQKLQLPIFDLPDNFLDVLFVRESSETSLRADGLFGTTSLLKLEALKHTLSLIPIDFISDIFPLAVSVFGVGSLAAYVASDVGQLSNFPSWDKAMDALDETFRYRKYWERLWIVQECIHAADLALLCGERQMDFSTVAVLDLIFQRKASTGSVTLWHNGDTESAVRLNRGMVNLMMLIYRRGSVVHQSLARTLGYHSDKECSDPRDHIYSLLNIVEYTGINVDYNKSVTEVFSEATRTVISQEESLDLLISGYWGQPIFHLPSWIPHYELSAYPWRLRAILGGKLFAAGGPMPSGHPPHKRTNTDLRVLSIHGFLYGSIGTAGERIDSYENTEISIRNIVKDIHRIALARDISSEEFWRTLFLNQYHDNLSYERTKSSEVADQNFKSDLLLFETTEMFPNRFWSTLRAMLNYKAFCITTANRGAMVLGDVEVGDRIFIARGCSVPLIIRPARGDRTHDKIKSKLGISALHELVGGAYVDGIMDGEVLVMADQGDLREEAVHLI